VAKTVPNGDADPSRKFLDKNKVFKKNKIPCINTGGS